MTEFWSKQLRDLIDDLDLGLNLDDQNRPPLEKYWDRHSDRWREGSDDYVVILAMGDVKLDGDVFLSGTEIHCPICGRSDKWQIEGDYKTQVIRVFVCEHKSKDLEKLGLLFWLPCRVVATVTADKVLKYTDAKGRINRE